MPTKEKAGRAVVETCQGIFEGKVSNINGCKLMVYTARG
jgi:hypothetical protein